MCACVRKYVGAQVRAFIVNSKQNAGNPHRFLRFACRMLGMHGSSGSAVEMNPMSSHKDNCNRLDYLVERQQQLCGLSENVLTVSAPT